MSRNFFSPRQRHEPLYITPESITSLYIHNIEPKTFTFTKLYMVPLQVRSLVDSKGQTWVKWRSLLDALGYPVSIPKLVDEELTKTSCPVARINDAELNPSRPDHKAHWVRLEDAERFAEGRMEIIRARVAPLLAELSAKRTTVAGVAVRQR